MRFAGEIPIERNASRSGYTRQNPVSQFRTGRQDREVITLLVHRQLIQYANAGFSEGRHFARNA